MRKGVYKSIRFWLRIGDNGSKYQQNQKQLSVIIDNEHRHLTDDLVKSFSKDPLVDVIVDRRIQERRKLLSKVTSDRRQADRRKNKIQIIEAVFCI